MISAEELAKLIVKPPPEFVVDPPDTATLVGHYPELTDVAVTDMSIPGRHGSIAARHYRRPGGTSEAGLVWVHGGAFVGGDLDMPESHWVSLTIAARGFPVLAVDHHKCLDGVHYPMPSDDVLDAWLWAREHTLDLGVPSSELHLGGASAGGNLVAGVTKRLRDGKGPLPRSLVLVYPVLHPELPPFSAELEKAIEPLDFTFTPDVVRVISLFYVETEAEFRDPYAFPANGDLAGQPPTYVLNSEADTLRASGEAYAAQLRDAGVPVKVELEPGTQHGHLNQPFTTPAERSLDRIGRWLHDRSVEVAH